MQAASNIEQLCERLGLDRRDLQPLHNYIDAAFYHANLPGTPRMDQYVSICSAIRMASVRIATRWEAGASVEGDCLVLSRAARELRDGLLTQPFKPPTPYPDWKRQITIEHQDPVNQVWKFIEAERMWEDAHNRQANIDRVADRLLRHPIAIVTREENERLNRLGLRWSGAPDQRYRAADIDLEFQPHGTLSFYVQTLGVKVRTRRSKWVEIES